MVLNLCDVYCHILYEMLKMSGGLYDSPAICLLIECAMVFESGGKIPAVNRLGEEQTFLPLALKGKSSKPI